jgi:hypothetical protein
MSSKLQLRGPVRLAGALRATALAALLATPLLASTAAQAAVVITSAARSVFADTSGSPPVTLSSNTTQGLFTQTVKSQIFFDTGDGPSATAAQNTGMEFDVGTTALQLGGTGSTNLDLFGGATGAAESVFSVFFTLTSSFDLFGTAALLAGGGDASHASVSLDHLGASGGNVFSGIDTLTPLNGILGPGDYSLVLRARSDSLDPVETGRASFGFALAFTAIDDPVQQVPEPQSLALALTGLAACGLLRRRPSAQRATAA